MLDGRRVRERMTATPTDLTQLRVDLVGSFLRPQDLKDAFEAYDRGAISQTALEELQDEAIRAIVAKQEAHALPIVTDGEFRRRVFLESFADVGGFDGAPVEQSVRLDPAREAPTVELERTRSVNKSATARIRLVRNRPLAEYEFAQALTDRPVKASLIATDQIVERFDERNTPKDVYESTEAFRADVIAVQRKIVQGLVDGGCRYVHIDAPGYTSYVDEHSVVERRARGEDPDASLERAIEADNAVIAGFPGVTFGLHVCRGNRRSQWHREGAYDAIAERLFSGLNHDRLLLEYDSDRAGGFEPLRFVPKGKTAVLGLITTKTGKLETVEGLMRRLDEAARYVSPDQLSLSPQCGFASVIEGNLLTEDEQWRKLDVMLETASQVWG